MTFALHIRTRVLSRAVIGLLFAGSLIPALSSPVLANVEAGKRKVALVYDGKGSCPEGCAAAAARIFRQLGLRIVYVNEKTLTRSLLKSAALYVQPGGNAIEVAKTYRIEQMDWIRNAISDGMGYVGFCAGSFFTDHTVDDEDTVLGLGILPGSSHDFIKDMIPRILPIRWKGEDRSVYFQGGAYFQVNHLVQVEQLATYSDGKAAALQFHFGKGRVSITGVHPEAPSGWLHPDESESLRDPDGRDYDLATSMGQWVLKKAN